MPFMPVDTDWYLTVGPLVDDTDFKSIEGAVVYNAAGMAVDCVKTKKDGTVVVTAVTLTNSGNYIWTDLGARGYYTIKIPASDGGAGVDNDEEGTMQLVGIATGVLPFESPVYDVVPVKVYNSLVGGTDNLETDTVQWIGTACATPTVNGVPEVDATHLNGVAQSLLDLKDFADDGYDPSTNKVQGVVLTDAATAVSNIVTANVTQISGDATAADNLEATFDGTGYTEPSAPAKQSQLSQLAITGSAVNTPATGNTLTTGSQVSGTYASTAALDGTYHQLADDTGTLDNYYEFGVGGDGIPTSVTITGYLTGINDSLTIQAYNWGGSSWDTIGTFAGQALAGDVARNYNLFTSHVGTGVNLGKVRIRYSGTGLTTANMYTNQIFTSYAIVNRSVGYADGSIWIDTVSGTAGTTNFVNGTADHPVNTLADALTLGTSLGIKRYKVVAGSSITLVSTADNKYFDGENWTLALGNQSIANAFFHGASVSGIGTGSGYTIENSRMGTTSLADGTLYGCALTSDITATAAGAYFLDQCYSGKAGATDNPSFDFGGAVGSTQLNLRHYAGGFEIKNMGAAGTDNMTFGGTGELIINANCSGGTIRIRGTVRLTDNVIGGFLGTLEDDARFAVDQELLSNVTKISGDATAADNLESILDTTGGHMTLKSASRAPLHVEATGGNFDALYTLGHGTGAGQHNIGGAGYVADGDSIGVLNQGGSTGGVGQYNEAMAGNHHGNKNLGSGTGAGVNDVGGSSGAGHSMQAGTGSNESGLKLEKDGTGEDFLCTKAEWESSGVGDIVIDGTTDLTTALKWILSKCVGKVNRSGSAYAFRDLADANTLFTLTSAASNRTRS